MTDVGDVALGVKSVSDLVDGILSRSDRDAPDKEQNELATKLQNYFADNQLDSDEFRLFIDRLLNLTNNPLTPTGDAGTGRRELLHSLLINTIALIHERRLTARLINQMTQK